MHAYPLAVLRRQMRDIRSPADLGHIERGTWHESAFVTRAEPPYLRADPGSWLAVDAAPERDDLRAATRVTDVGSYR